MTTEPGIQGLRGAAAALVLAYHLTLPTTANSLLDWSQEGTVLFFVVSGYILARRWNASAYARPAAFYLRRVFRIWPLYLLVLPVFWLVGTMTPTPLDLVFAQDLLPSTFFPANPTWTLCVEELFYAAFPAWMALYGGRGAVPATVGFGVLSVVWVGTAFAFPSPTDVFLVHQLPSYLFAYGLGTLVAVRSVRLPAWVGAAAVAGLAVGWSAGVLGPLAEGVAALAFAAVLAGWRASGPAASRTAVAVGAWTYPLYLLGVPVEYVFVGLLGWTVPMALLTVAATVGLAALAHRFVEVPFIALGARIERRWLA